MEYRGVPPGKILQPGVESTVQNPHNQNGTAGWASPIMPALLSGIIALCEHTAIAFDRCQWQWCEITSGFESNPILASSLDGMPLPRHRKLLFSLLEGYCHGELLDSISWRTINSGNCWCLGVSVGRGIRWGCRWLYTTDDSECWLAT